MQSSKDIVANLCDALASNDESGTAWAAGSFRSLIRTQLSVRNAKTHSVVASILNDVLKRPEIWREMPKFEMAGEEFQPDAAIETGFSLVTCCMNRNDHLLQTLPTWLVHKEIDEIVIVDWSSEIPVAITLETAGIRDPRVRILRVEDEGSWILSHAYNLGFRATTKDKIVKVDSDIILNAEFFSRNAMGVGKLIAGNWRQATSDQSHVNGFFVVGREDLMAVNGFNERIVTYGWDDDDLYDRLTNEGVERVDVDPDTVRHIDHSDSRRIDRPKSRPVTGWDEVQALPQFWIALNRQTALSSAPWDSSSPMAGFRLLCDSGNVTRMRRSYPFGVDTNLIGTRLERAEAAVSAI